MKILYIPLDERPCNAIYPIKTANVNNELKIKTPSIELLGVKKKPGKVKEIRKFLLENFDDCEYGVFSAEMLLYGGLLPSRLHQKSANDLETYKQFLIDLKNKYPEKKIFFSNLIMRTPKYNSSDEEPDYYEEFGESIFRYGWLKDKLARESLTNEELVEKKEVQDILPDEVIEDYENRRRFNLDVNLLHVTLAEEGVIDFLSIPQDDSAPYGYTAMDQKEVYGEISKRRLKEKVMVYPGADEVGFTLIARAYNDYLSTTPSIYVRYSSTLGPQMIPLYEDRPMNESLKSHVLAAGFKLSDTPDHADFILAYNTPGKNMQESWDQLTEKDITYDSFRQLLPFIKQIQADIEAEKKVALCDAAFSNGGEIELIELLDDVGVLEQLVSYKAWNTNCNSLGSSIAALAFCQNAYDGQKVRENLLCNLYEDLFYQTIIRKKITNEQLEKRGLTYFDLGDQEMEIREIVRNWITDYHQSILKNSFTDKKITLDQLSFPWNRMFEILCTVKSEES